MILPSAVLAENSLKESSLGHWFQFETASDHSRLFTSLRVCVITSSAADELFLHPRRLAYVQGEPSHYRSPEPDRAGVGPDASRRRARGCRSAQTSAHGSGGRGTSRMGIVACGKRSVGVSRCARGLAQ